MIRFPTAERRRQAEVLDVVVWEPSDLEQALTLLAEHGDAARPLAGGTDLLVQLRQGRQRCRHLVSLEGLRGWDEARVDGEVVLGSMVRVATLERHHPLRAAVPFLAEAAGQLGSRQVRNLATAGGNLCNAAPSAELAPPLLALEARARVVGPEGEREVPLESFFLGPGSTALGRGELLRQVSFRVPAGRWHGVYFKLSPRRAMDIAVVNVAVLLVAGKDGTIADARLALGAVAPQPLRARGAEDLLRGRVLTAELLERAAQAAAEASRPISDVRAPADYRRAMVKALVARGLRQAWRALTRGEVGA